MLRTLRPPPPEFKDARIDRLLVPVRVEYLETIRNKRRQD